MFKHLESHGSAARALGVLPHTTQQQAGFLNTQHWKVCKRDKEKSVTHCQGQKNSVIQVILSLRNYTKNELLQHFLLKKKKREGENSNILNKYGKPQHKVLWYIKILNLQSFNPPLWQIHPLHT